MDERNGSTTTGPGTAEIPVVRPAGASAAPKSARKAAKAAAPAATPAAAPDAGVPVVAPADVAEAVAAPEPAPADRELPPGAQPTAPVSVRPSPRMPRRGPLTVMGPWAPVAGGLLGLVLGGIVAAVLGGVAESYDQRLSIVFVVLGLGMLGTAGTLLADEVRIVRQQARDAVVRPQWVEATAGLVNGLTPARLLTLASVVVLVLAAYVGRG
ncbi:hypothetical protein SAMN05660748_3274 [Blastococcus aggregatus]|uniref:Uncharacterized protein n=1 Tax=Blastococcus aggregatus TaxID=38502 RepID=A0A285V8U2_9ACTN|nr:hypothetical protein [Blastococcus aggregatus]SOC50524.1 hypothetical protein SAMN05660748_3274 [Blastococcus aggregatus]